MYRVSGFVQHYAWALIAGSALATLWVNLDAAGYYDLIEWRLPGMSDLLRGQGRAITLRDLVGDGLMAFFVFCLGKEFWEAMRLDRGALRGDRAGVPVLAAVGGMAGAVLVWLLASALFQTADESGFGTGWTVPLGGDVALGYLFARAVFGPGNRAVLILMLMTIAMDIAALLVMGLAFPAAGLNLFWLLLPVGASLTVWQLYGRRAVAGGSEQDRRRALVLWPYVLAGLVSWVGTVAAGLPGALALLPILPAIPHADHSFGLFAEAEEFLRDPLNRFAHLLARPLIVIVGLFGFTHGGLDLAAWTATSGIVLAAMWLGKPAGVLVGALIVAPRLGLRLPQGLRRRDMGLIAVLSGIGFTVPALSINLGLPGGAMQEAARLGIACTLLAGPVAVLLARRLGVKRRD